MEADPSLFSFNVALGVLLVDILLSGDNAIVIALVCRSLSLEQRTRALWLGVLGAFVARLVLTSCATLMMNLPLIKLIGGLLLLKISIELIVDNANPDLNAQKHAHSSERNFLSAAKTIVMADIVMSLDNVLALSAVSQNSWSMLVAGLMLSIPILMFGSLYIARLLDVFPYFLWVGGAILGGISGALLIEDPIFDGAFSNASSMAPLIVPLLAAGFVVQISRVIAANARRMQSVARPPSLLDIVWAGVADAPVATHLADASVPQVLALKAAVSAQTSTPVPSLAVDLPAQTVKAPVPSFKPVPATSGGEYKVLMALGLFMMLTGGVLYYMLNVYEPTVPNRFFTYMCKQPAMTISYMPEAKEIRFATVGGVVKTSVIEDRIVWDDYRDAGAKLTMPPPVKIVSVDARKLVVNGGMFENTACYSTAQ